MKALYSFSNNVLLLCPFIPLCGINSIYLFVCGIFMKTFSQHRNTKCDKVAFDYKSRLLINWKVISYIFIFCFFPYLLFFCFLHKWYFTKQFKTKSTDYTSNVSIKSWAALQGIRLLNQKKKVEGRWIFVLALKVLLGDDTIEFTLTLVLILLVFSFLTTLLYIFYTST